jgi:hypothetical protein
MSIGRKNNLRCNEINRKKPYTQINTNHKLKINIEFPQQSVTDESNHQPIMINVKEI